MLFKIVIKRAENEVMFRMALMSLLAEVNQPVSFISLKATNNAVYFLFRDTMDVP